MAAFAGRLRQLYDAKPGDLVDELCANLRFPAAAATADERASVLACVAHAVQRLPGAAGALPDACPGELLCLRQYTQRPVDVDRDLGWSGVPPPGGPASAQKVYEDAHQDWDWERDPAKGARNGSLFGPVCAALRDQGPGGRKESWGEGVLRRWVKWLCTISACCAAGPPAAAPDTLWRGLGGGGLPAAVVEQHRGLRPGALLGWPALSSTSGDGQASREYMLGTAVNAQGRPTTERPGTILFRIDPSAALPGREISTLSQYPAEREILLGACTVFRITADAEPDWANPHRAPDGAAMGLVVQMEITGTCGAQPPPAVLEFFRRVRAEAAAASARLVPPAHPSRSPGAAAAATPQAAAAALAALAAASTLAAAGLSSSRALAAAASLAAAAAAVHTRVAEVLLRRRTGFGSGETVEAACDLGAGNDVVDEGALGVIIKGSDQHIDRLVVEFARASAAPLRLSVLPDMLRRPDAAAAVAAEQARHG